MIWHMSFVFARIKTIGYVGFVSTCYLHLALDVGPSLFLQF